MDEPRPEPIVVAGSDAASLAALQSAIEAGGQRVVQARNVTEAVAACAEGADVLVLDGGAGVNALCARLAENDGTRGIAVIVVGPASEEKLVASLEAGAADYVEQPLRAAVLRARIGARLRQARSRRELLARNAELESQNRGLRAAQAADNSEADLAGTVLDGKYRLDEPIGSGGYGTVFRGQHLHLARAVAIKVFRPSPGNDTPEALTRFRIEGKNLSRLQHPNIVAVYDCGVSQSGLAYIVMELLQGRTLEDEMAEHAPIPLERCAQVLHPVLEALEAMHKQGIVYRDVKPGNIFLHRTPREVVKVLDFGIAKLLQEGSPESALSRGIVVGVPAYAAPERLQGRTYDGRADVYSVGVLLYQMLSGRLPYAARPQESLMAATVRAFKEPPPPLQSEDVPPEVERMIVLALAPDPAKRPTARELGEALAVWR